MTERAVAVDTQDLDSSSWQWARVVAHVDNWLASATELFVEGEASHARSSVMLLREQMNEHARALREAARTYDDCEAGIQHISQRVSDVVWWLCGRVAPLLVSTFGPGIGVAVGTAKVVEALLRQFAPATAVEYSRVTDRALASALSSPELVRAVELSVGSLDEALAGFAGIPLPLVVALGSAGLGVTTTEGTARLVSRLNAIASKPEDAMTASAGGDTLAHTEVERLESVPSHAPQDFAEVLQRIPTDSDSGAQVRIEQYERTFVVYIGGTVDSTLGASAQPWDMSSNLAALGGDPAASEQAVRQAMADLGITPNDSVILVGHSQGGLIAMRIAQANDVAASAVITAGAPIHHIAAPSGICVVAFEHVDDVVPALAGPRGDPSAGSSSTYYVRRTALAEGQLDGNDMLPAHHIGAYVETARLSSEVQDARLDESRRLLTQLDSQGTSTLWRARRR